MKDAEQGTPQQGDARLGVVAQQRIDNFFEAHFAGEHPMWIRSDLVLLDVSTDRVDVGDSSHIAKLRLYDPVLDRTQLGGADRVGRFRVDRPDGVHEDFAQPRSDRSENRRDIARQRSARFLEPLVDQLTRKVNIGPFVENGSNLRKTVAGQ